MLCFASDELTLVPYLENGREIYLRAPVADTYVKSTGSDEHGNGTPAHPFATIARAYGQVKDTGTIHVMDDLQVGTDVAFNSAKVVTITSCKANGGAWATAADTHTIDDTNPIYAGGVVGTFKATSLAGTGTSDAPGVMALCYERNCAVTGASHCDMMQTADKSLILGCYASKETPRGTGIYAVKDAADSTFVGCYTTANQAPTFAADNNGTFDNCYFVGTGTACAATDEAVGITAETMKKSIDGALTQMNTALKDTYDTVTGSLRIGYMAGQSAQMNGNYNYPVYAVYLLTVNSLPSSVYGTYTVTADSKDNATGATGFNQYWVAKDAVVKITGANSDYAEGAITYDPMGSITMDADKTVTVTFTPKYYPAWTINTDLTSQAIYDGVVSGTLGNTGEKLSGNTILTNWTWDVTGAADTNYLQSQSNWAACEPNNSGTHATYNYQGGFDDTNGISKLLQVDKPLAYLNGGKTGLFYPTSGITRGEVAQLFYNLLLDQTAPKAPRAFTDVPADMWCALAIQKLTDMGILKGIDGKRFAPNALITRAEFTAIAVRFSTGISSGTLHFPDVSADYWAYYEIAEASNAIDHGTAKK